MISSTGPKSENTLREELNKVYEDLYVIDPHTLSKQPKVCTICDTFVKPSEFQTLQLSQLNKFKQQLQSDHTEELNDALKQDYRFTSIPQEFKHITDDVLLSPRGTFLYDRKKQPSISVCKYCRVCLIRGYSPKYAISNGYFFGTPPQCLLDLTPTELAWITPVNPRFGLVFVYHGGTMKQLKGTLSYFRKKEEAVALAVSKMQLVGLAEGELSIALVGATTSKQKEAARRISTLRPTKVKEAVEWLVAHNKDWENIDLEEIKKGLLDPVVVQDHSELTIEIDSNIEETSTFRVVFPDSNFSEAQGGQRNASEFLRMALKEGNGQQVTLQSQFDEERVQDYMGRNLIKACILQHPYGRGGRSEVHLAKGGKDVKPDHDEYIAHLSKVSQPHFHSQQHVLMLFNYLLKDRLVRKASIQCASPRTAKAIAEDVTGPAILKALTEKRDGKKVSDIPAQKLLYAIDAIAQAAPHSNEAARTARNKVETLQIHLGAPAWFVTITPDDGFTFLLNIYAFEDLDLDLSDWETISNLTDEELKQRSKKREQLKLNAPGICAWNFENQLDAIIRYVFGWDLKKDEPTKSNGYFGKCRGYALSVEEQGRKALHTHCIVFIDKVKEAWSMLHHNRFRKRKRQATEEMCMAIDRVSSCKLIGSIDQADTEKVFPHSMGGKVCKCTRNTRHMREPKIIGGTKQGRLQRLRNLRHKKGRKVDGGAYLNCDHAGCKRKWSAEEMIHNYLKNVVGISGLSCYPDNRIKRLKTTAMALIQNVGADNTIATAAFEAGWNHHIHICPSCFKQTTKNNGCECRYRYPKAPQIGTAVVDTKRTTEWYSWDGIKTLRTIFEPSPKRYKFDVFMNQSAPAIGRNKLLLGNTNCAILVPGAVANYVTKYVFKKTQEDDSKEYNGVSKRVEGSIKRIHERNLERKAAAQKDDISDTERKKMNKSAALAATLSLGFSMSNSNVIGAPLAAYLLRNETRFKMSHSTKWVSMNDINTLLNDGSVKVFFQGNYGNNHAYDYLCRPEQLEKVSVKDFYTHYVYLKRQPTEENRGMPFINTAKFNHPSWKDGSNAGDGNFRGCMRELKEDEEVKLIQIARKWLPDTGTLEGSLQDATRLSPHTEEYCRRALMLCVAFRQLQDLRLIGQRTTALIARPALNEQEKEFAENLNRDGSYTDYFMSCITDGTIDKEDIEYLQNYQDCIYNGYRTPKIGDALERQSEVYKKGASDTIDDVEDEDDEDDEPVSQQPLDDFDEELMKLIFDELCSESPTSETQCKPPNIFSTVDMKTKVRSTLRPNQIARMDPFKVKEMKDADPNMHWIETMSPLVVSQRDQNQNTLKPPPASRKHKNIVEIIITETTRLVRNTDYMENKEVMQANGSAKSIVDWSTKSKLDCYQMEAFEIITAAFVLTFFEEEDHGNISAVANQFEKEKQNLHCLGDWKKRSKDGQIISLLHGPGGSGKSWVIDMVMQYAKEYTSHIADFKFDKRTIIVTALTGCAATLIRGETLHSALGLNSRQQIQAPSRKMFEQTRMIIVDEISFANERNIRKMNTNLKAFKDNDLPFGGIHVVFTGDFRQLDPVAAPPLYLSDIFAGFINLYMELKGKHRYSDDVAWGEFLWKFRDGTITIREIEEFNEYLKQKRKRAALPQNIKYATYTNADRDMINANVFDKALDNGAECLVVFASSPKVLPENSKRYKPMKDPKKLWNNVSESGAKTSGSLRIDPVLKLYKGMTVLVTENTDVQNGIANGTQAYITKVVLKPNEQLSETVMFSTQDTQRPVKSVLASQIDHIELKHHNQNVSKPYFKLEPKDIPFTSSIPCLGEVRKDIKLKATQLPVVANMATTGHKLQGVTCNSIFVHTWMQGNGKRSCNWNYVVLSRVKTREGMYSRLDLPKNLEIYQVPQELTHMLQLFRGSLTPSTSEERHNFNP